MKNIYYAAEVPELVKGCALAVLDNEFKTLAAETADIKLAKLHGVQLLLAEVEKQCKAAEEAEE